MTECHMHTPLSILVVRLMRDTMVNIGVWCFSSLSVGGLTECHMLTHLSILVVRLMRDTMVR